MKFYDALEVLKRGETVKHAGKTYRMLARGIHDVTDESDPKRVALTQAEWDAAQ